MYYYRLISSMLKAVISSLGTGLYAVYKAESNANDSLGNYNGTPEGGLTYTAGKSGNAFTFNGTDADIDLISGFQFTGNFSVNFWSYVVNTGQLQALVGNYNRTGTTRSGFMVANFGTTNVYIGTNVSGSPIVLSETSTITYSSWFMTTVTRESGTATKIYRDGVLQNSNTDVNNPAYSGSNRPYLGVYTADGAKTNFAGSGTKIDEVGVWNKVLTATEVTELYNAAAGKFYPY